MSSTPPPSDDAPPAIPADRNEGTPRSSIDLPTTKPTEAPAAFEGPGSDDPDIELLPSRRAPPKGVSKWRRRVLYGFLCCCVLTLIALGITLPIVLGGGVSNSQKNNEQYDVWKHFAAALRNASDRHVEPCDSFYNRTCGGMLAHTTLAPGQSSAGSFSTVASRIDQQLHTIAEQGWPLVGTWYDACMDGPARRAAGITPILPLLTSVDTARSLQQFAVALAKLHRNGVSALFSVYVEPDELAPTTRNLFYVDEATPALPYSIWSANNTIATQERHRLIAYASDALGRDAAMVALSIDQQQLARYTMPPDEARHAQRRNLVNVTELNATDTFPWDAYFDELGFHPEQVSIVSPSYMQAALSIIALNDWAAWRDYLAWRLILTVGQDLPPPPQNLTVSADTCLQSVESALGPYLAHYYVQEYFPPETKPQVSLLVSAMFDAFGARIEQSTWMDNATRTAALAKLNAIHPMIAFPDKWDDSMPPYVVSRTNHLANVIAARASAAQDNLSQLDKTPTRYHWLMDAYTVNAYYEPQDNDIVFPAGILQGSFFHPEAPLAINFGGLGVVIGHEITHGFDDQGREYGPSGAHANWWTPASTAAFEERAQCVVDLYSSFTGVLGEYVNGELTLGENLADLGGLATAWDAYHTTLRTTMTKSQRKQYERAVQYVFDMTHEQLFFASYGFTWCTKVSPDRAYRRLHSDPHSPPRWRVDGPTSQSDAFAQTFQCPAPQDPCVVW